YNERNTGPNTATFPQLMRVLVSYRDQAGSVKVGYASTLAEALNQVIPAAGALATPPGGDPATRPRPGSAPPAIEVTPPTEDGDQQQQSTPPPASGSRDKDAAAAELDRKIDAVRSAMRSGNFEDFGKALEELEAAVEAYQEAGRGPGPSPSRWAEFSAQEARGQRQRPPSSPVTTGAADHVLIVIMC